VSTSFLGQTLADLLGVSRESVIRWRSAYSSRGLEALPQERSGRPLGSGRLLSDQQASQIQGLLNNHSPEDLGIAAPLFKPPPQNLWAGKLLFGQLFPGFSA
jgi:transposase